MYGSSPFSTLPFATQPASGGIALASVAALPLGGTLTAAVALTLGSARALPVGGSVTGTVRIAVGSARALPLTGSAAVTVRIAATSTRTLPLGGTVLLTAAPVGGGSALPLWRWAGRGRALAAHLRPARQFASVARLPLAGAIALTVMDDVEAPVDDLLLALLLEEDYVY